MMIMTIKRDAREANTSLKIQMNIEEFFFCKFRSILNTFSIDQNIKKKGGGGVSGHESQKIKKNPNHDSRK